MPTKRKDKQHRNQKGMRQSTRVLPFIVQRHVHHGDKTRHETHRVIIQDTSTIVGKVGPLHPTVHMQQIIAVGDNHGMRDQNVKEVTLLAGMDRGATLHPHTQNQDNHLLQLAEADKTLAAHLAIDRGHPQVLAVGTDSQSPLFWVFQPSQTPLTIS